MNWFTRTADARRPGPRHGPAFVACLVAATAAGCGPDGGIVLEIHRAPGADTEIYRLELRVGMGHDTGGTRALDPDWWISVPVGAGKGTVALPDGLGAATFRYKLEAGEAVSADEPLVVAVLGYGADPTSPPILFGHTSELGVRFAEGEARVIDVPLENFVPGRHGVGKAGCVWWNDDDNRAASEAVRDHAIVPDADSDCDGYAEGHDEMGGCQLDCADLDPSISPEAAEVCDDGIDQNCCAFDLDGRADPDGDQVNGCSETPDCVDMPRGTVVAVDVFGRSVKSEDIHPGATEVCDGLDNDCSGACDDDPGLDPDGDDWLNCVIPDETQGVHRKPDGRCVPAPLDCADAGPVRGVLAKEINPGAVDDQCDQIDNDCSGDCDEAKVASGDGDGDGFAACGTVGPPTGEQPVCRLGRVSDCDDDDHLGVPGGLERCDGLDFSCDGALFEGTLPCFRQDVQDRCVIGARTCTDGTGAQMPAGPCMPDANAPAVTLPPGFCSAACSFDDLSECVGGDDLTCDVLLRAPAVTPLVTPCLPADVPLVGDPGPGCRWTLLGGAAQGDWKVTLQRGNLSGNEFQGCGLPAVSLRVLGASAQPADRSVLILHNTRLQVIRLRHRDVPVCEASGIECH